MGCWNETCFISHLPIRWGDEIALIILAPNHPIQIGETCYSDELYVPIGFPLFGKYDEYGGIEEFSISSDMDNYLKYFADKYVYVKKGFDNKFNKYEWDNTENFIEDLTRHSLYVDRIEQKLPMEFVMIHKELYNRLLQNMSNRSPYGQNDTLAELYDDKIRKTITKLKRKKEELLEDFGNKSLFSSFYSFSSEVHYSNDIYWNSLDFFADLYMVNNSKEILNGIRDHIIWRRVMEYGRSGYHCYSGAGSQSCEYKIHRIIAEYIIEKGNEYVASDPDYTLEETVWW